jgi:hypothetical protein
MAQAKTIRGRFRYRRTPTDVGVPTIEITNIIPDGTQGVAYSFSFVATGGTLPYTWSITAGALPTGLSLTASTGLVSGTPTGSGVSSFTIRVDDSAGHNASLGTSITIEASVQALEIITTTLRDAEVGIAYATTITATGGTPPYTWDVVSGSVPSPLSLAGSTGVISGTALSLADNPTFTVRVRDAVLASDTQDFDIDFVTAVDEYAYFDFWKASDPLHNSGFTTIPSDGAAGDFAYKLAGPNADEQAALSVQNDKKTPSYSYTGTDIPDNVKLTLLESTSGIVSGSGCIFPINMGSGGNIVIVWDEWMDSDVITAQEANPNPTASANIDKFKWRQIGFQSAGTGRMYEMRARFDRRNITGESSESSPRRVTRWDVRVYDDQKVNSGVLPLYVTEPEGYYPTGQYAEETGMVPSYEEKWARHIVQIRQKKVGSDFISWSTWNNPTDTDGIPDNAKSVTSITHVGTTATVTIPAHDWKVGFEIRVQGATPSTYNGRFTIVSVPTLNTFTYTLPSDPGADATGTILAGTDYDEFSWWIGNEDDGWHCVYYKVPWKHMPNGVRQWWGEHDTSTNVPTSTVVRLTRSGSTATGYTGTSPVSVTSINRTGSTATVVTSAPHGLSSTASHRYILLFGSDQAEYNGGFDAAYVDPTTFTITVTGTPATPATGSATMYKSAGHLMNIDQSVRIAGASDAAYNGDYQITDVSRSTVGGTLDTFAYSVVGTPTSPASGTITCQRPLLNDGHIFYRGLFALENYDSPGMAAGAGIKDPISSPGSYDTDLFILPKS